MSPSTPGDVERALGGGEGREGGGLSAKAGVILAIHNIFIVILQFLVTDLSAMIFAIFDAPRRRARTAAGRDRDGAELGGLCFGFGSAVLGIHRVRLAWRLAREMRRR
ncbi:hypothetical protein B0H13DRAFT_2078044, partial [Mycena leptocephala]